MSSLHIDPEFQSLIPPLTDDEFQRLEKSILAEGVRDPIITWGGTIIDGHNRYRICTEHGVDFKTTEREFASRDDAKIWIIGNQLGRRNLEPGQKAALVIERSEAKVREQARLRRSEHGNTAPGRPKNTGAQENPSVTGLVAEKGRTAEILARQAGVGHATIKRVLKVKQEDSELYDKVRNGEIAAMAAYTQVMNREKDQCDKPQETHRHAEPKKPKFAEDGRRICSVCGEPIDDGDSYKGHEAMHKKCHNVRTSSLRYKFPEKSLLENVATYTTESLKAELLSSAEAMKTALKESIAINESMGVQLTRKQKKDLSAAVANVIRTINRI